MVVEVAKSGARLSSGNVNDIGKPMHCINVDIDRGIARKVKTRWNDIPE